MDIIRNDEAWRIWIINRLSEKLEEHAILKGGMVLRLLGCSRYTNDLDYVFIPFKSKKDVISPIKGAFEGLEGVSLEFKLHSTNAQFFVTLENQYGRFRAQIEISVSDHCEAQSLSTADMSNQYQLAPHVIRVMKFDVMLAHKLAAWNERRLMRDIYDAYFIYKNLNVLPNGDVLKMRLKAVRYAKRVTDKSLPKEMTLDFFCDVLQAELKTLTNAMLEEELRDFLDVHQLSGLDVKIRMTLTEMIEQLRSS